MSDGPESRSPDDRREGASRSRRRGPEPSRLGRRPTAERGQRRARRARQLAFVDEYGLRLSRKRSTNSTDVIGAARRRTGGVRITRSGWPGCVTSGRRSRRARWSSSWPSLSWRSSSSVSVAVCPGCWEARAPTTEHPIGVLTPGRSVVLPTAPSNTLPGSGRVRQHDASADDSAAADPAAVRRVDRESNRRGRCLGTSVLHPRSGRGDVSGLGREVLRST